MMSRPPVVLSPLAMLCFLVVLVAPATAQESKPTSVAQQKKLTPLQKLLAAGEADRAAALVEYIEDQVATNAIYAGQYSALRKLEWNVQKLLQQWISKAPRQVMNKDALRRASINALRDLIEEGKASDDLRDVLKQLAEDWFEHAEVRKAAVYALAQFGDRTLVEKAIEEATKKTKAEDINSQVQGYYDLANIHYNLRQYDDAVKAYRQLIKLGGSRLSPVVLYNCACSLALAGKKDEAFAMLEESLKRNRPGGMGKRLLETDMDIQSLRKDERFAGLMKKYFGTPTKEPGAKEPEPTSRPTSRPAGGKREDKQQ